MITSRLSSLVIDFALALLPAYGGYIGGLDFVLSLFLIYLFSMLFELIYTKGQTVGMIIMRIRPLNLNGSRPKIIKLLLYHLLLVVFVVNVFSPLTSKLPSIFIVIATNFPFCYEHKYHSLLDLLFKLQWINYSKDKDNNDH